MTRNLFFIVLFLILFIFAGCQSSHQVEVKPVEIKPIHITIDVNIRVEKALDDFFDDLEAAEDEIKE
ncbi:YnbE family lipoprotein [Desulfobacula sp.]|uniref:YnbE family lipoprotein n=1 Tax=Desulfobacula sp. TaxID=2593537 RepID=UPI00263130B5|nr:YnbE family lipoprotein [Desulfobacula sp.]